MHLKPLTIFTLVCSAALLGAQTSKWLKTLKGYLSWVRGKFLSLACYWLVNTIITSCTMRDDDHIQFNPFQKFALTVLSRVAFALISNWYLCASRNFLLFFQGCVETLWARQQRVLAIVSTTRSFWFSHAGWRPNWLFVARWRDGYFATPWRCQWVCQFYVYRNPSGGLGQVGVYDIVLDTIRTEQCISASVLKHRSWVFTLNWAYSIVCNSYTRYAWDSSARVGCSAHNLALSIVFESLHILTL